MLLRNRKNLNFRYPKQKIAAVEVAITRDYDSCKIHEVVIDGLARYFSHRPEVTASVFCHQAASIHFHESTSSEFFAVCGSAEALLVIHKTLELTNGVNACYGDDISHTKTGWVIYQIEDGCIWQALDEKTWTTLSLPDTSP